MKDVTKSKKTKSKKVEIVHIDLRPSIFSIFKVYFNLEWVLLLIVM